MPDELTTTKTTSLSKIKATKKIVLAELEKRLIENEDMPRNEASVFMLNALGVPCSMDGINSQKIKEAFNTLSYRNKQIFLKGMELYLERKTALEKDFHKGNIKGIAKLPYHLCKMAIKGGTRGFSVGLAVNQIFPSLLPVNFGTTIEQLPNLVEQLGITVPEYFNSVLQTISFLGASAVPQNIYHGTVLVGATVLGATAYTLTKGSVNTMKSLCNFARNKTKKHRIEKYMKQHPKPQIESKKTDEISI